MSDGIRCPICRGPTGVTNTKQERDRTRRRRKCLTGDCPGWLWTIEQCESSPPADMVLIRRSTLRRLRSLVEAICSSPVEHEIACASPEQPAIPVIE